SAIKVCDLCGGDVKEMMGKADPSVATATSGWQRRVAERCGTDPHATTACVAPAKARAECRLEALRDSGQAGATKKEKQIPRSLSDARRSARPKPARSG